MNYDQVFGPEDRYVGYAEELPDPPDNFEFLELFTPAQQDAIAGRFVRGIALHESRLYEARARHARSERMAQARRERRALAREAYLKSRFNPVIPHDYKR